MKRFRYRSEHSLRSTRAGILLEVCQIKQYSNNGKTLSTAPSAAYYLRAERDAGSNPATATIYPIFFVRSPTYT